MIVVYLNSKPTMLPGAASNKKSAIPLRTKANFNLIGLITSSNAQGASYKDIYLVYKERPAIT